MFGIWYLFEVYLTCEKNLQQLSWSDLTKPSNSRKMILTIKNILFGPVKSDQHNFWWILFALRIRFWQIPQPFTFYVHFPVFFYFSIKLWYCNIFGVVLTFYICKNMYKISELAIFDLYNFLSNLSFNKLFNTKCDVRLRVLDISHWAIMKIYLDFI